MLVCTDGLRPELDAVLELPDDQLSVRLAALARRPGNDDIAVIDVGLAPRAMPAGDPVTGSTPRPPRPADTGRIGAAPPHPRRSASRPRPPTPSPARSRSRLRSPPAFGHRRGADGADLGRRSAPARVPTQARTVRPLWSRRGAAARSGRAGAVQWQDHVVTWSAVPGADSYSVQICREPSFAEPLLYTVPGLSFTVPPPARPHVRAGAVRGRRRAGAVGRRARPVRAAAGCDRCAVTIPYRPFDGDAWLGRDLPLDGGPYRIVPESAFAVAEEMAFARQGRKARVFKLLGPDGASYALKTFYRGFSLPEYVPLTRSVQAFADFPGLRSCQRRVIDEAEAEAVGEPGLAFAILMPWIDGVSWAGVVEARFPLDARTCVGLAVRHRARPGPPGAQRAHPRRRVQLQRGGHQHRRTGRRSS